MKRSTKQLALAGMTVLVILVALPLFAAFEAHVVNVTARIENALFVHPESLEFGTVFPQEHLISSFGVMLSESFSERDQRRVGQVEYIIKQKPKPRQETVDELGVEGARDWCHQNPLDLVKCYPSLCPYLSKHPDNVPVANDTGLPAFHDPETEHALGKLVKFKNGSTINNDPIDQWVINLAVPCFENHCAQDWDSFVKGHNPDADPDAFMLPEVLESETFGCDMWVEVIGIF